METGKHAKVLSDLRDRIQSNKGPGIDSLPLYLNSIKLITPFLVIPIPHISYCIVEVIRFNKNEKPKDLYACI